MAERKLYQKYTQKSTQKIRKTVKYKKRLAGTMDELKELLLDTLNASQKTMGVHNSGAQKVKEALKEALNEAGGKEEDKTKVIEEFHRVLFKDVCKFLVSDDSRQNSSVERAIRFTAKLVGTLTVSGVDAEAGDFLLSSLCKASESSSKAVRLRSVQLVVAILDLLSDEDAEGGFEIDEGVFSTLVECMSKRSHDKNAPVRLEAVLALSRLQNPEDKEDPVIGLFLHAMEVDPSPLVRKAILTNIAITAPTLRQILHRIRDSNDNVRAAAFRVLSEKVDVRSLSLKQKVSVVSTGNGDRSPVVRNIFSSMVRDQWLESLSTEHDPLAVIRCINPSENEKEAELLAKCLSSVQRPASSTSASSKIFSDAQPEPEEALWWRMQCMAAIKKDPMGVPDELLPDLTALAGTLEKSATGNTFVCLQILRVTEAAARGSSDVVGRDACAQTLCRLLKSGDVSDSLVEQILETLSASWSSVVEGKHILLDETLGELLNTSEENLGFFEAFQYRIALIGYFALCTCREYMEAAEVNSLFQKVGLPSVQHREARIREVGVKIAAVSCIVAPYAETLEIFLPIIVVALKNDQPSVRCIATKGLFDIAGMFGLDKLDTVVKTVNVRTELLSAFDEVSSEGVSSDDAGLLAVFSEGFAKLFFQGLLGANDRFDSSEVLARLAVFMHLPVLRKPPLLRQCLSVFFSAYVCPPRNREGIIKATERMHLLERTVGPAMEYAVKVEGTLEFAVKLARFLLRLVLAGTQMIAAASGSVGNIGAADATAAAAAGTQNRILLDLAGRAYKQVDDGGSLSRVYCFILSKCSLAFVNFDEDEVIKLLMGYVELLLEKSDDALSKKALGVFSRALKKDKRFKSNFVDENEKEAYKEKAKKRLEEPEPETEPEPEPEQETGPDEDENKEEEEENETGKVENKDNDEDKDNELDDTEFVVKHKETEEKDNKEDEEEEPKTPEQNKENVYSTTTPLKKNSSSSIALVQDKDEERVKEGEMKEEIHEEGLTDLQLRRRERRRTIAGIPNPDWYISPLKSPSRMKLYPRRMSLEPNPKPESLTKSNESDKEEEDDEEIDFYDDANEDSNTDTENEETEAPPKKKRHTEDKRASQQNDESKDKEKEEEEEIDEEMNNTEENVKNDGDEAPKEIEKKVRGKIDKSYVIIF